MLVQSVSLRLTHVLPVHIVDFLLDLRLAHLFDLFDLGA